MKSPDAKGPVPKDQIHQEARALVEGLSKAFLKDNEPPRPKRKRPSESVLVPRSPKLADSPEDPINVPFSFRPFRLFGQQHEGSKDKPAASEAILETRHYAKRTGLLIDNLKSSTNYRKRKMSFDVPTPQNDQPKDGKSLAKLFEQSEWAVGRVYDKIEDVRKESLNQVAKLEEQVRVLQGQIIDLESERDLQKMQEPQGEIEKAELTRKLEEQELKTLNVEKELEKERADRKAAEKTLTGVQELIKMRTG